MDGQGVIRAMEALLSPSQVEGRSSGSKAYDSDAYTVDRSAPFCVVFPTDTSQVQKVVAWCHQNGVPFTPRGAGTGLSGGAMAALGGVVISTKKLTAILDVQIENRCLLAQAGAVNLKLTKLVEKEGLHFAPDPSSQSVSTLGGNIAENSGGPHTLKYGVTAPHILGLTMVEYDGSLLTVGGPNSDSPGLDLTALIVGSEGTLGIVTEAWIRLTPLPEKVETCLAHFPSIRAATQTVAAIIAQGILPAALEMMDLRILEAVRQAFGVDFPIGTKASLIIECDGSPAQAKADMEEALDICRSQGAIEVKAAASEAERQQLWMARKKGVGAMGRIAPTIVTHDGVIPRSLLPEMLEYAAEVADEAGVLLANIFHAGDGNLHPIFCFDDREPGVVDRVVEAGEKLIRRCIELGGSVTGEHGVGVEKADLLSLMFDEDDMALQEMAKGAFHKSALCNPCKVIPSQKGCTEHRLRWRGAAT